MSTRHFTTDFRRHLDEADFGLLIKDESIHVPVELGHLLDHNNIRSIEEFLAILMDFPGTFTSSLHWTPHQFALARTCALDLLQEQVDAIVLTDDVTFRRGMGAMPPVTQKMSQTKTDS